MNITTIITIIGAASVVKALMNIFEWMERRGNRS